MNRRTLLAMIPLAPAAFTLPLMATEHVEATPLDTRPTFKLADFVLWVNYDRMPCRACGEIHDVNTHGCVPLAFSLKLSADRPSTIPATRDAIPMDVYQGCPFGGSPVSAPHQHHDFRWTDA